MFCIFVARKRRKKHKIMLTSIKLSRTLKNIQMVGCEAKSHLFPFFIIFITKYFVILALNMASDEINTKYKDQMSDSKSKKSLLIKLLWIVVCIIFVSCGLLYVFNRQSNNPIEEYIADQNEESEKVDSEPELIIETEIVVEQDLKSSQNVLREKRLSAYNLDPRIEKPLGSKYLVVSIKSQPLWGIIDRDGNIVVKLNYSQPSGVLKNGYYALCNKQGWDVFDTSAKKIDSGLETLDKYR